jgi:halimadienyl-diphosphate synthase
MKPVEQSSNRVIDPEAIQAGIERTLSRLGRGDMDSVAYDTAWMARLAPKYPDAGFDQALTWLRERQHSDGSWGSEVMHYHDRTICTLAAIIALKIAGESAHDEDRIREGENFLWRHFGQLFVDANDTGNFQGLVALMLDEASVLDIDVPRHLYQKMDGIGKKLAILRDDPSRWRQHPLSFSLEVFGIGLPKDANFLEENGSIGVSPAATASFLEHSPHRNVHALDYITRSIQPDGGAPNFLPVDTFEVAWALNDLRLAGAITPDHPEVRRCLDFLWKTWSPERGLSVSSYSRVTDLDDTAVGFAMLKWGGYTVSADVFAGYELADHFRCWPDETDQSLSVHVRTFAALKMVPTYPQYDAWTRKILELVRRLSKIGHFWFDKWHVSPYYLTSAAIRFLQGSCDDLIAPYIKWILKTQHVDGGWGYYGQSTPEETAYCLQALLYWDRTVERMEWTPLQAAAVYLNEHLHDDYFVPLWIGKCLYSPPNIVRSSILAALHSFVVQGGAL